jgi:hypothetical protein
MGTGTTQRGEKKKESGSEWDEADGGADKSLEIKRLGKTHPQRRVEGALGNSTKSLKIKRLG